MSTKVPALSTPPSTPTTSTGVFVSTLAALDNGRSLIELDDTLRELTRHVQEKQIKGKLTLELSVVPNGEGVGGVPLLRVVDNISVTLPKKKRNGQTFFADDDNNLTRRHPGQGEMKLVVVSEKESTQAEPKTAAAK